MSNQQPNNPTTTTANVTNTGESTKTATTAKTPASATSILTDLHTTICRQQQLLRRHRRSSTVSFAAIVEAKTITAYNDTLEVSSTDSNRHLQPPDKAKVQLSKNNAPDNITHQPKSDSTSNPSKPFFIASHQRIPPNTGKRDQLQNLKQFLFIPAVLVIGIVFMLIFKERRSRMRDEIPKNCTYHQLLQGIFGTLTNTLRQRKHELHQCVQSPAQMFMCSVEHLCANQVEITALSPLSTNDSSNRLINCVMELESVTVYGFIKCSLSDQKHDFRIRLAGVRLEGRLTARQGHLIFSGETFTFKNRTFIKMPKTQDLTGLETMLLKNLYTMIEYELNTLPWPTDLDKCLHFLLGY